MNAGVALISTPRHAELALDLCHPLQAFDTVQSVVLAVLSPPAIEFVRLDFGAPSEIVPSKTLQVDSPPDSPPPEA